MGEAHEFRAAEQSRPVERGQGRHARLGPWAPGGRHAGSGRGERVGFDLPTRLLLLGLGSFQLWRYADQSAGDALRIVLTLYGCTVAIACLGVVPPLHRISRRLGLLDERTKGERAILDFLIDATFVTAVAVLAPYSALVLGVMSLLAGIRLFRGYTGASIAIIFLPFSLGVLVLGIRYADALTTAAGGAWLISKVMLVTCLLILAFRLVRQGPRTALERARESNGPERAAAPGPEPPVRPSRDSRDLAEQVLRLTVLQEGISAINSTMVLNDLLQMVVANAVRVLKAEQSSIGLLDDRTGELVIQAATGVQSGSLAAQRFAPGVGVAGWVIQHGQLLKVDDVTHDDRYLHAYSADSAGSTTRSILCVPLKVERQVIGALCVTHSQPAALTVDDERLLTTFAEQASLAVHKTRLLEQRTRQAEELRQRGDLIGSLMSIRQVVLSSLELPQVLSMILTQIGAFIWSEDAAIYLLHARTGQPRLATSMHQRGAAEEHLLRPGTVTWPMWERSLLSGPIADASPTASLLIIPLIRRGIALGCVMLLRPVDRPFAQSERDAATPLAELATIAVDNAQLFNSRAMQQQQATALYRLMMHVSETHSTQELGQVVCTQIQKLTQAQAVGLLIHDLEQGGFSGCAASGAWQDHPQVERVRLARQGDSFVTGVLQMIQQRAPGQLVIVPAAPRQWQASFGTGPALSIPLTLGRRLLGLIILQPGAAATLPDELMGTLSLAVSYCAVALEHAELLEQAVRTARDSATLHRSATAVLSALDLETVITTTAARCVAALPIDSCEVYLLDDRREQLRRRGLHTRLGAEHRGWQPGPEIVPLASSRFNLEAMRSPGLTTGDVLPVQESGPDATPPAVILARLMGSGEVMGLVRLTTHLPAAEFIRQYTPFCQTLFMHAGGALQRSLLYTTTARQAEKLRVRTRHLHDILRVGNVPTAQVPAHALFPSLASGIAGSLGFRYTQIGVLREDATMVQWYVGTGNHAGSPRRAVPPAMPRTVVDQLRQVGYSPGPDFPGVYLTDALVAGCDPRAADGADEDALLILLPLDATDGTTLGYLLAAARGPLHTTQTAEDRELQEVLSIFAQRVALHLENQQIYSQLLASKRKIEAVVLSIGEGVIVTDDAGRIVLTNGLADQTLGVSPAASVGQPIGQLLPNPAVLQQLEECLATGASSTADADFAVGRELRTYQIAVDAITGGDLGAVLALRDVTLARASERAKSDFLSIVSHELRTPLNSVMAFLDVILMGKTGPLTELQADFLATAKQEAVSLQGLIDELLDYTRLQSRMLRLEQVPMDLSAVIVRVARKVAAKLSQEDLSLRNDVPADILVIGDEVRLEQVFKNLVDNAVKFSHPHGEIRIHAWPAGERVVVQVHDTGSGIPAAELSQVFERFFQGENRPARRQPGLGLGLAICKGIVEAHGGRIWIESEPGVGTTVYVELALFAATADLDTLECDPDAAGGLAADLFQIAPPEDRPSRAGQALLLSHATGLRPGPDRA
ncbi:MAG TPA: ATP-binding protein [Chloroflexia bacterium]|nr:ATP-binding protein [Chloroflexia bacterium]